MTNDKAGGGVKLKEWARLVRSAKAHVAEQLSSLRERGTVYKPAGRAALDPEKKE